MKAITIYLGDFANAGTNPEAELDQKKIFGSCFCQEHQTGLLLVRPSGQGLDVLCALSLLEDMRRKLMSLAGGDPLAH